MSENSELKLEDLDGLDLEDWDPVNSLNSKEAVAAYMSDILAEGDINLFNSALADVARAIGMGKVAEYAGLTREGLYKALRPTSKPRFETITSVLRALGLAVRVVPIEGVNPVDEADLPKSGVRKAFKPDDTVRTVFLDFASINKALTDVANIHKALTDEALADVKRIMDGLVIVDGSDKYARAILKNFTYNFDYKTPKAATSSPDSFAPPIRNWSLRN